MAVFLFSLAAIPPLFGFWPKYVVFEAAVSAGLVPLAFAGVVVSVIGAFYYIAIVKTMYFDDEAETVIQHGGSRIEGAVIGVSALWLSVVGYLVIPMLAVAAAGAAAVLFSSGEGRVGKECVSTCRYVGSPDYVKKKIKKRNTQ